MRDETSFDARDAPAAGHATDEAQHAAGRAARRPADASATPDAAPPRAATEVEERATAARDGALRRGLREPLLQVLVLGMGLLVVWRLTTPPVEPPPGPHRIELTAADLRDIGASWLAQGRAAPSAAELKKLIELRVREEVLAREALALGLDRGDAIVRQRLAQKMSYLVDDVAGLREPGEDELRAWFADHRARFVVPARVSFRQLYFSRDRRGARARDDAAIALATLAAAPDAAADVGDPFLFEESFADRSVEEVTAQFGPAFASALLALPHDAWLGPLESGYGWHLVRVDAMTPERTPDFADVTAAVRSAWSEEQLDVLRRRAYEAIRARYEVVLPDDGHEAAPVPAHEVKQ